MSFDSLGLAPALVQAVAEQGYSTPTQIQARAIPEIIAGRDLLAAAQTGTGKTAAFTLPMLHRLRTTSAQPVAERHVRALVLVPTRELAMQVAESVRTYGLHLHGLRTVMIFGGVSIRPQIEGLRRGVDVVVATPGRLLDHVGQGTVDLSKVEFLVLDEADRMLDMGFIRDIRKLIERLPRKRQNLLFSATFSPDIRKLAEGLLQDPVTIDIAPRNSAAQTVDQRAVMVAKGDKSALLSYLIGSRNWRQVLVFTRTKHGANRLADRLNRDGIPTAALHGNKSQNARTKALAEFKSGQVRTLVATDIAARGIDIDQLPHVVNFELPSVAEDYVHRIGRTGRAGEVGEALSLVCREEQDEWRAIEKLLKRSIEMVQVEGFVPGSGARDPEPERPSRPPQGRHGQRQNAGRPATGGQRAGERRPGGGGQSSRPSGDRPAAGAQPGARSAQGRPQGHATGRPQGGPSRGAAGAGPRRSGQGRRGPQGGGRSSAGR